MCCFFFLLAIVSQNNKRKAGINIHFLLKSDFIFSSRIMHNALKIRIYWGLLTLFGLFAVYSTSIWKSFDQRFEQTIVQNIETVKAFNTFLDETILKTTQKVIEKSVSVSTISATGEQLWSGSEASGFRVELQELPKLSTLEATGEEVKLVLNEKKSIQSKNNYYYFSGQLKNLFVSLIAVVLVLLFPLPLLKEKKLIFTITVIVFLFQLCVFLPGIGATNGTARWWVDFPWLPNMQPAEFFKLGYVFFMSYWIIKRREIIKSAGFLTQFAVINAIILLIILAIPDMGTLFILALTGTIMAWYNGLKASKIWILVGAAWIIALLGIWTISMWNPENYALTRLRTFVTTDEEAKKEISRKEWRQNYQGLIAIWWWGLLGQGYGKGLQKMGQLPEAYSDMIFAAFSEEIGFVGNMLLFALYMGLFFTVLKQLSQVRDPQLKTLAVGIISLIIIQVFVHVGVNVEILPNTGLTLPFVSHGGTALMINLIELALLYKILRGK